MFQRVFVLDKNKRLLTPCHQARARILLSQGDASVYCKEPFTIILKKEVNEEIANVKIITNNNKISLLLFRNGKEEVIWSGKNNKSSIIRKIKKTYSKNE